VPQFLEEEPCAHWAEVGDALSSQGKGSETGEAEVHSKSISTGVGAQLH